MVERRARIGDGVVKGTRTTHTVSAAGGSLLRLLLRDCATLACMRLEAHYPRMQEQPRKPWSDNCLKDGVSHDKRFRERLGVQHGG